METLRDRSLVLLAWVATANAIVFGNGVRNLQSYIQANHGCNQGLYTVKTQSDMDALKTWLQANSPAGQERYYYANVFAGPSTCSSGTCSGNQIGYLTDNSFTQCTDCTVPLPVTGNANLGGCGHDPVPLRVRTDGAVDIVNPASTSSSVLYCESESYHTGIAVCADSVPTGSCSATALARNCRWSAGGCWCYTHGTYTTGNDLCDYSSYAGTYYSLNGRDSTQTSITGIGAQAIHIADALNDQGLSPSLTSCTYTSCAGGDCATNIFSSTLRAASLSCWSNSDRWSRSNNVVRCTNFELPAPSCPEVNDHLVELPTPTLTTPSINDNNYILPISAHVYYTRVQIVFDAAGSTCNFDSDVGASNGWTVVTDNCTVDYTLTKAAQTVLASASGCSFDRDDNVNPGFATYSKTISVITSQTRRIDHAQNTRNQTYTQTKTTQFTLFVKVPLTFTHTLNNVQVTGNITVLQAVASLGVDVGDPNYLVSFDLLTSSQAPYSLTYKSFTSTSDLGNTISVGPSFACVDSAASTTCVQTFTFSNLAITTACPTKSSLNDAMTITFDVGCKPSFTGNCNLPSPSEITVSFTLVSSAYCPQVLSVSLSGELDTFRDVDLLSSSVWSAAQETQNFVVGSTLYGRVTVSVGQNAATTVTTRIRKLTTFGLNGAAVVVYDSPSLINSGEFTGKALHELVAGGTASYISGTNAVSGNSLVLGPATQTHALYMRLNLINAGQLTSSQKLIVTLTIDYSYSGDNDFVIGISDGTNVAAWQIEDVNVAYARSGTLGSTTFSPGSASAGVSIVRNMPMTLTYEIEHGVGSTMTIRNNDNVIGTRSITHAYDVTAAQYVYFIGNHNYETYTINKLKIFVEGNGAATVENGDAETGGSVDWANDAASARFAIPLVHTDTVVLDPITDQVQTVTVSAEADVTFATSAQQQRNAILQVWSAKNTGRSHPIGLSAGDTSTGFATAQFGVVNSGQPTQSAASSSTGSTTLVAVAVCAASLVIVAAYVAGNRRSVQPAEVDAQKESMTLQVVSTDIRSSSCTALADMGSTSTDVDTEESNTNVDESVGLSR